MLCIETSKENKSLPAAEIGSFCRIRKVTKNLVFCDLNDGSKIGDLRRLAMSKNVNEVLFCSKDLKGLHEKIENISFEGSFCVRVVGERKRVEKDIGSRIKGKVNLENPQNEFRVFFINDEIIFSKKLFSIRENFEERRATKRPFFSPVSIHPKIARVMVNISGSKNSIFDPFCGTGGILIEAGLMGLTIYGADISERMVEGCIKNLKFFGIENFKLENRDISELEFRDFEAIVTDLPYGRSSFTNKEGLSSLYSRSFEKFHELLKKNGRAVICVNDPTLLKLAKGFKIDSFHELYVHRNMKRYIYSLVKE